MRTNKQIMKRDVDEQVIRAAYETALAKASPRLRPFPYGLFRGMFLARQDQKRRHEVFAAVSAAAMKEHRENHPELYALDAAMESLAAAKEALERERARGGVAFHGLSPHFSDGFMAAMLEVARCEIEVESMTREGVNQWNY